MDPLFDRRYEESYVSNMRFPRLNRNSEILYKRIIKATSLTARICVDSQSEEQRIQIAVTWNSRGFA